MINRNENHGPFKKISMGYFDLNTLQINMEIISLINSIYLKNKPLHELRGIHYFNYL